MSTNNLNITNTADLNGAIPIGSTALGLAAWTQITAGTGISVVNGSNSIVINATGVGGTPTAFLAALTSTASNVTGDGTEYGPIIFDGVILNDNSAYNAGTGEFTAPDDGTFLFTLNLQTGDYFGGAFDIYQMYIKVSGGRTAYMVEMNPSSVADINGIVEITGTSILNLNMGDVVTAYVLVDGGALTIDLIGAAVTSMITTFAGVQIQASMGGGGVALTFVEDTGMASEAGGVINVVGGTGIVTSGAGNTITIDANGNVNYVAIDITDSPYSALSTDYYISVDVNGGPITVRLPNAPATGRVFVVKDSEGLAAVSNITVTTVGGVVNIDGSTSFVMNTAHQAASFIFGAAGYEIF